jgi:probable F420-dependent oxidoreductase
MNIGLKLPSSGEMATPAFMGELAVQADRLGYHSLQISDHVVIPAQIKPRYPYSASGVPRWPTDTDYFEPVGMLGWLAGKTQSARLGTSVLVLPYRHPVVTAKQLATIDALSGGRVFIGIGAGWMQEEFEILGSPPYEERGAITDEYISIFRTLWNEELPQYAGRYTSFPPLGANPRPVQQGGIPIIVGGNTKPAIRRAARLGDGWMPLNLAPGELTNGIQYLRAQLDKDGRSADGFGIYLGVNLRMTKGPTERRESESNPYTALVGPAREVMGTLRTYADLGVTELAISTRTCVSEDEVRETVQLCGELLVPAFANAELVR